MSDTRLSRRKRSVTRTPRPRTRLFVERLEDRTLLDVGGTIGTALNTLLGPGAGTFVNASEAIGGDSPDGANDIDIYEFQAAAGFRLTAETSLPPSGADMDTFMRLFDSSGTQLAFDDDGGADLYSRVVFTFTTTGTYYIGISSFDNSAYNPVTGAGSTDGTTTGDYQLRLDLEEPPASTDVGGTLSTALDTLLGPGAGTFVRSSEPIGNGPDGNRDVDMYLFQAAANTTLRAQTSQPPGGTSFDSYLRLFDSSGAQLAFDDDSGPGAYSDLTFIITTAGTYYIGVSGFNNSAYSPITGAGTVPGSTGDYQLRLDLTAGPTEPDPIGETISTAFNTELGPTSGSFSRVERIGDGLFGNQDIDMYAFQAPGGSTFSAATVLPPSGSSFDTYLRLFDASGNQLAFDDDGGPGTLSLISNFLIQATGTYYIGVTGFNNSVYNADTGAGRRAGATGNYQLNLSLAVPDPGEIRGVKFHDLNQDGVRDEGEPGLEGWRIYVDLNRNGQFDAATEPFALTNADGEYAISILPGSYTVAEEPQEGWVRTLPGDTIPTRMIEDFESGDLSGYVRVVRSFPPVAIEGTAAHDGGLGLQYGDTDAWLVRNDPAARVARGDTITGWVQFAGAVDGRAHLAFGATPPVDFFTTGPGSGTLSLVLAGNTGQLLIQQNIGYAYNTIASVAVAQPYQADTWYRVEVDWLPDGRIIGRLFGIDGTTLISTVATANPVTVIAAGGIGFRGWGSTKYFDTITVRSGLPGTHTVAVTEGGISSGFDFGNFFVGTERSGGGVASLSAASHGGTTGGEESGDGSVVDGATLVSLLVEPEESTTLPPERGVDEEPLAPVLIDEVFSELEETGPTGEFESEQESGEGGHPLEGLEPILEELEPALT